MQQTTRGLVLRTVKYGERQVIIDMLTERLGRVSFIAPLPRSSKAKVRTQLLQPLALVELTFDYRPAVRLQKLGELRLSVPYVSLMFHPLKLPIGLFLAEFLLYATRNEQPDEALFAYVEHGLRWLDAAAEGFVNFHLVFMMRLTRFLGFYPNVEGWHAGSVFDLRLGEFTGVVPAHTDYVPVAEAARMRTLLRMNYETMHRFVFSREERKRCIALILAFYRLHVPSFPELRSLPVLEEMFN